MKKIADHKRPADIKVLNHFAQFYAKTKLHQKSFMEIVIIFYDNIPQRMLTGKKGLAIFKKIGRSMSPG